MSGASVSRRLGAAARRFIRAREGNIAVIFALAAVPIISFVGAAIDYTRATAARSSMQAALDSTALMLSKDLSVGTINASQISEKASAYFNALYNNKDANNVTVTATYVPPSGSTPATIKIDGSGSIVTEFMRVAGFPNLGFGTSSTTTWGNVRMRVALVLDVTGSMRQDGKMDAMKPAAKNLVDQLSKLAANNGDIYISLVPFAKDVNLGTSFVNESWINWSVWENANRNVGTCSNTNYTTRRSCRDAGSTWTPDHSKWTGCITDRDQDYDTKNTEPSSSNPPTMVVAEDYIDSSGENYCKSGNNPYLGKIVPLSYNWSTIKSAIDALQPTGNTNQGIGLAWGWMTLTQSAPFNAPPKDPNFVYKDAIVLLSDGLNTQNRWYSDAASIDARQKILCDNAKAAGITIYTVQVNTGGDPTSQVLKYCAQNASSFYLVTSASQTASVFSQIGTQLSKLRVSK